MYATYCARYSCVYWVDHLYDCYPTNNTTHDLRDDGSIDQFLRQYYLYWPEALSLFRIAPMGILSMAKLDGLLRVSLTYLLWKRY